MKTKIAIAYDKMLSDFSKILDKRGDKKIQRPKYAIGQAVTMAVPPMKNRSNYEIKYIYRHRGSYLYKTERRNIRFMKTQGVPFKTYLFTQEQIDQYTKSENDHGQK